MPRRDNSRTTVTTGNAWEEKYGYSRAVRVGAHIHVAGTLGIEEDGSLADTAEGQARRAIRIILSALGKCKATGSDLVHVRGYVTNINDVDEVGRSFKEMIVDEWSVRPCLTQVAVAALAHPEAKVELEAEAVVAAEEAD